MENSMKKYQVTIHFEMDDDFMSLVPSHRVYIDALIDKGIVDQYVVSMETQRVWITFTANDKEEVEEYLVKSPIHKYWSYEIDELFIYDGIHYRLPAVQLN
jgi:muconolactone delta-isomerase